MMCYRGDTLPPLPASLIEHNETHTPSRSDCADCRFDAELEYRDRFGVWPDTKEP